jgi:predicted nucleic acid-binding Zn ribbon protein
MSKIRRLITIFRITRTTSIQNAKSFDDLKINSTLIFRGLLKREVVLAVGNDTYYLSEENLLKYNKRRQKIVLGFLVVLILILLISNIYLGLK